MSPGDSALFGIWLRSTLSLDKGRLPVEGRA